MNSATPQLPPRNAHATFGFLNVVELPSIGHCGGLLIVSSIGRPIEFHCTSPVASNRTQQIMYGKTYMGFLLSDQIGAALLEKVKNPPSVLITNRADMLPIGELIDWPLILIDAKDAEHPFDGSGLSYLDGREHHLWCVNVPKDQEDLLRHHTDQFLDKLPFDEPMERIAQAIEEAHAVLRAA